MSDMKISEGRRESKGDTLRISYEISIREQTKTLWFELDNRYESFVSELLDAPLVALLIPFMVIGGDITIEGYISDKLLLNFNLFKRLLLNVIPTLKDVSITCKGTRTETGERGVITGFSGGIDSYCTLFDFYYSENVNPKYKITHLLFNNVGSHGAGDIGSKLFKERYDSLKNVTDQIGLPFIKLDSNLDDFYPRHLDFLQTYSYRNAAAPLLLQKGISLSLHSSGKDVSITSSRRSVDMADSDLIGLPLISNDKVELKSVGSEYTRVEKTIIVASAKDSWNTLDVCISGSKSNCSKCSKCMRTLLTLEIAGLMDLYKSSFDFDAYYKNKDVYIANCIWSSCTFQRDIMDYIKRENYPVSFVAYIMSLYFGPKNWFLKVAKKIVKKYFYKN